MKHPDTSANPYCEVDWAEFENLGVEGKLGRYPFHWHMLDDARRAGQRPFLEDCSVHHCFNRFVTIHHSSNVDVERNVGYDTLGSGFFLEDSTETGVPVGNSVQGVRLVGNLGMKVGRPSGFVLGYPALYQDLDLVDPSVYWIQHPNQVVEDNHAAGAAGHGFYLAPNDLADGFSHPASGASSFKNNVAHSNGQHGFYHQTRVQWGWQTGDAPAGEGLIAWKNRRYGIWWRTYGTSLLEGCAVADNKSGIYPASEGRQNAHDGAAPATCRLTIRDAVIFGETPNLGEIAAGNPAEVAAQRSLPQTYWNFQRPENLASPHESPWDTLNGLEAYDGRNLFEDLKLAWFPDARTLPDPNGGGGAAQLQVVAGLTQVEYNSKFAEDPRNSVAGLEFVASGPERVFHPVRYRATAAGQAHSMVRNTVVYDEDGSLGYGADVYLCYLDDFFEANATAVGTRDFGRNLLILPTAAVDFAQFEVHTNLVGTTPMDVSVAHQTLGPVGLRVGQMSGSATKDFFFNAPIGLDSNPNTLREGVYSCTFPNATAIPTQYTIKIQFAEAAGLPTIIGVPLLNLDPIKRVKLNNSLITNTEPSLNALLGSIHENVYFHDSVNSILYVRTTSIVLGPSGSADLDGTRNILTINL